MFAVLKKSDENIEPFFDNWFPFLGTAMAGKIQRKNNIDMELVKIEYDRLYSFGFVVMNIVNQFDSL